MTLSEVLYCAREHSLASKDGRLILGGVLTGGREACVECGPNFKPLASLVAEISVEKSFSIVTVCQGPTIGFR